MTLAWNRPKTNSSLIRTAGLLDTDSIHQLVNGAYRGESGRQGWTTESDLLAGQRCDREQIREILQETTDTLRLLEIGGEIAACVLITRKTVERSHLGMLSVNPRFQNRGLGRQMVEDAERWARCEFRSERMEMTVIAQRAALIAWYERLGYRPTGERRPFPYGNERFGIPLKDDLHFVVLEKSLTFSLSADVGVRPPR